MWLGERFSIHASVYLQRTLTAPKSLFCSRVPLRSASIIFSTVQYSTDRLLDERSVVPASRGYRPLINPPRLWENNLNITLCATLFRCCLLLFLLLGFGSVLGLGLRSGFLGLWLGLVLVLGYGTAQLIRFQLGVWTGPANSEITIIYRTVQRITSAVLSICFYCSASIPYHGQKANWLYQERKFPVGTFVLRSESSRELAFLGLYSQKVVNGGRWYDDRTLSVRSTIAIHKRNRTYDRRKF